MKLNISKLFTYALAATFVGLPSIAFAADGNLKSDDPVGITFWLISIGMVAATVFFFMESMKVEAHWRTSLVVAGLVLLRQNKLLPGFLVSLLGISLQIRANHYQMTYYMLLLLMIYFIVYLIDSYRKNDLKDYLKYVAIFTLAGILSLGLNAPNILTTYDLSLIHI